MERRYGTGASFSPSHPRTARGFTLIEVLVVVLIIGITLSFAVLTVSSGEDELVETEARRFAALVKLAGEEAVLRSQELAVEVQRSGYRFARSDAGKWVPLEDDRLLRARELPPEIVIEGLLNGEPIPFELLEEGDTPRIFLLSSGEMTPFELEFKLDFGASYGVSGDFTGKIDFLGRTDATES